MDNRTSTPTGKLFALLVWLLVAPAAFAGEQPPMAKAQMIDALKKTQNTISFIENKGQWPADVKVAGNTNIGNMYIMDDHIHFLSFAEKKHEAGKEETAEDEAKESEELSHQEVQGWGIYLDGSNKDYTVSKEQEMPTKYNYFIGQTYNASDAASYGELTLNNIYKGVDLRVYSQHEHVMEFDWLVNAGADFSNIKMRFKGQDGLSIDENGNLNVKLKFDAVKFDIPEAYQIINGKKVMVKMAFDIIGDVASFKAISKIDSRYDLVIDPSLKWGTWFDNNNDTFDEYLFAVDLDNAGNVYCGGNINMQLTSGAGNYINPASLFGYSNTYNASVDGIIYKLKFDGSAVLAITYFGTSANDRLYGLSLSPDKSTVFFCGLTAGTLPTGSTTAFDGTISTSEDGFVGVLSAAALNTLQYTTYIGGTGNSDEMVSIRALSNNSFVVGGHVNAALTTSAPNYISNAYDASYAGGIEMYIAKFTSFNTLAFGTYIGGTGTDQLNDIQIFGDGAIAFSGSSDNATGFTTLFNNAANGVANTTGGLDGVIGVLPANGGASAQMLSRFGGTGDDEFYGLTIDPFDTLYVTGFTSSTNFYLGPNATAANRFQTTKGTGQDAFVGKISRNGWNGGATDPWAATYFGGSGDDRGNTLRTYTPYAVMIFGESQSDRYPFNKNLTDGGAFFDSTANGGWDIFYQVLGTDLKTQYFATLIGGAQNDYLGQTGTPHGSNHFQVEGDSLICLGTTSHSSTLTPNPVSASGVFDPNRTADTDNDDIHLVFKWRIGNLLNFDYSDAPVSYGTPNHVVFNTLKLGSTIDKEDFAQVSYKANGDDLLTTDDEDGIPGNPTQVLVQDTSTRFTQTVNVTNTTSVPAMLMGWIDFKENGAFGDTISEVDTVLVPPGATTATLTWRGYNADNSFRNAAKDTTYLRLRITSQTSFMVTNPSPTANAANGEVEDYLVVRYHCVNLSSATIDTNSTTGCGLATGSIVITNGNLTPGVQYGVYITKNGSAVQDTFYFTAAVGTGTLTVSGLTAGTYTAIQVFHPTNPACAYSVPGTFVIIDPAAPAKPGITAAVNQVCLNGSFSLTATGPGTFNWTGPNGFTANTASFTRSPATALMAGSYCVHQTVASCVSADSCITITVNPLPTLTAGSNTPVCTGGTINLTSTPAAGTSPYPTFAWSGVGGFTASSQNASNGPPATAGMAGAYSVTVTDSKGCTATATTSVVVNTSPSVAPTSNSPICSGTGKTLTLTANPTGTISTYSWSGPSSFVSALQNPTRTNALATYSGTYTVNVTASNSCTATGNVTVVVNESPAAAPTSNSPVCANATLSFNANPSLGTTPYTYVWSGPIPITNGTTQTPFVSNAQTSATGTYNVTVTSANTCTATASVSATVNPNPVAAPSSNSPICQGAQLNLLTNPSGGSGTFSTYNWSGPSFTSSSQNPSVTNAQPASSGTYNVTVTDNRGCTGTGSTSVTINANPTLTASSNSAVCAPTPLNLTSTPSGGSGVYSTYSWSGPSYTNATQSPTRTPSTTAMTGTYNVTVTDNRGCTASATTNVTVNATLVATASSNTPVCSGGTLNLSSTPNGAASYVWSGPASFSSNAQNPSRSSAIAGYAGTYNVTVTDGNGCSGSANTVVVVNSGISVAPSSNTPVCTGAAINLSSNVTGGTAPITYTWAGPNSFSNAGANPSVPSAVIASGGTYNLTVSDVNGCSASGTTTVVVNQSPSISASSNTPVCTGLTINLNSTPSSGTTPYRFTWSGPASFVSQAEDTTRGTATLAMGGTYSVTVRDNNNCSATASTVVVINQSPSISASSNTPVCETLTLNLTSTPTSGTPGYTFSWGGPVTFSSSSQNPSRSAMTLAMAGTYGVTVTDANSCTASASTVVSVTPKPATETASALPNPICTGNLLSLSVTGTGGTWSWTGPNSFTSSTQNPTISAVTLAAAGTYNVTHTVSGCTSDAASVVVVVNQTPGTPTAGASPNPICSGNTLSLTATGVGTSWSWSGPNGFTSTTQNPTIPNITTAGTGTYSVFQTISGCTSVAAGTVSVTVNQTPTAPSLSSNNPSCYGDTLKLFAGTVAGATYSWTGPGGFTSSLQNPVRPNATPSMNGTYSLNVTVLGCTSVTASTVLVSSIVSCPPVAVNDAYSTTEDVTLTVPATGVLVNDYDNSNPAQPLTLNTTPVCNPSHGSVTINANGSFTYIPVANYNGSDTFCYSICDNEVPAACDTAIVVITVVPVNDPPVVNDTTITTPEDNPVTVCLTISDPETGSQSHILSAISCGPSHGIILSSNVNNGSNPHAICITYSPNLNFNGSDSICIVVCDNGTPQLCDNAVIHITVTPVNDKPVAVDDYFVSCTDTAVIKNFMTNDFDVDGPSLQYTGVVFGPFIGTITSGPTIGGNFTYTPPVLFNGIDSFEYVICDFGSTNLCDTALVILDYTCFNVPPVAADDHFTINEDQTLNNTVATNDFDPDDASLNYNTTPVVNVSNGTLTLNSDGTFTYVPNPNYFGLDTFVYSACDDELPVKCDTATVFITVLPVNDPPVVRDTTITTPEDVPFTVCLPITDIESFDLHVAAINCSAANGALSSLAVNNLSNPHEVCITYSPNANYNGSDSFCVLVCDNGTPSRCDTAVVHVTVTPVNDPPVASNDNYSTNEDVSLVTTSVTGVRNNDNDNADGNAVGTLSVTTNPVVDVTHGSLSLSSDGHFTYTPTANYCGTDSFQYRVCDNGTPLPSLCDTATAYITIVCVNDPPVVIDTPITQCEDCGPITVCIPVTDVDAGQQHFIAATYCGPNSGSLSSTLNGPSYDALCVTYTPNANFNGNDSICIIVCDNGSPSLCDTTHITITVTPVNDPPIAVNDNYSTNEDTPLTTTSVTGVRNNDNDNADGNAVGTLSVTTTPVIDVTHGSLSLSSDGHFTYTPTANYCGTDSFQYRVCDNGTPLPSLCDTATAYITIVCVNDPPVVIDTPITQCEDCGPITVCIPVTDVDAGQQHFIAATYCGPNSGSVSSTLNGPSYDALCVTYTPNANFNGNDSICIIVCDNGSPSLCDTTHITITVTPVNDPPIAVNDNYSTNEDVALVTTSVTGVRNNDNDNADGNAVGTLSVTTTPVVDVTHGSLSLSSDGHFTYTPTANYCGTDSFQYRVCDNGTPLPSLCDTATAYIAIVCVNDPPVVNDTTVTTPEDTPITVCIPISDNDAADIHAYSLCGNSVNGTSVISVNNGSLPHTVCVTYTPYTNFYGADSICIIICDNGSPQGCDTTHVRINVTPVNDPPWADTVYVYTYENQPVGVNLSGATGDPDGNPLTYTYGSPTPNNGAVTVVGNGTVDVTPNSGFTGTFTIPYQVCDLSPYNVNILCANAAIVVVVLPSGDTLNNHAPVANNDFATAPVNTSIVINVLNNDYDPDGDNPLSVTVTTLPNHGTVSVNPNGTINYTPTTGFSGYDTLTYTLCDPIGTTLPRPLCDQATVIISINLDPIVTVNDPPVAADDFAEICTNASVTFRLLQNDYDQNGNAITSCSIIQNVSNGVLTNPGFGVYFYDPNNGFAGYDTLLYRICDNGSPSLCDTGMAVIHVLPNPTLTPNVASITNCSNDSVNILVSSDVPGTTITWTATNGTSGTGNVHTVLANTGTTSLTVTYTFTGVSAGGCGSSSVSVPVTVGPRPIATSFINTSLVCSGENVVINVLSNIGGTTFAWSGSDGTSGTGNTISANPVNNGTSTIVVNYVIIPTYNGCTGDSLVVPVSVKPRPVLSLNPSAQTVCSGTPITIAISSTVPGTNVTWVATDGNSGNTFTINDSPVNINSGNIVVTYTVNGAFNGCNASTVFGSVTVRPRVLADAGQDKNVTSCSGSCVQIGGSPTGSGGAGSITYSWSPTSGLSSSTSANPTACGILTNTAFTVTVTDVFGCSATDVMNINSLPSSLTAEAGAGGAFCLASGDSVMLGGFPTAVGGVPAYTYTWAPAGLNLTNPANPWAFPVSTTKYYLTLTDAIGCTSIDSTIVTVYPQLFANAGADTVVCAGFSANLGGNPTAVAGSGGGFTYAWAPTNNVSNTAVANPTAAPVVTTSYVVTVTDGNGCRASDTIQVVVRPTPVAQAGPDKTITACPGDSVILGDNPAATGGVPGYTYSWSPSTGIITSTTIANPIVKSLSSSQTYTLVVTDVNGCTSSDNITVNVLSSSLQAQAGLSKSVCSNNNCVQIGGLPTSAGGTSPYFYTWSNSSSLSSSSESNPLACPSGSTTYTVTVTDSKGCSATSSTVVTVNPAPVANAGPDTSVCSGSTIGIGGAPSATGGTPGYTYSWNPTTGLSSPAVSNPSASPIVITTYQLIVTDSKGCAALDEITVTPRPNPVVDAGGDKTLVACAGDTAFMTVNISSGTGPYTFVWSPATALNSSTIQNPYATGLTVTTSYQVQATDAFGCSAVDFIVVNVVQSTLQANAGNDGTLCANTGNSVTIGGTPTAAGGTSPYVYTWASSPAGFSSGLSNPAVTPTVTTTYYVTVVDAKGCSSVDSVKVNFNPAPAANAGIDSTMCSGFCVTLGATPAATGGTGPYQYLWAPTVGLNANNNPNPLACPLVTTTYNVVVTDANGCQSSDAVTITIRSNPVANAGVDQTLVNCTSDSLIIGGSPSATGGAGGYTYSWSPATGLSSVSASNPVVNGINISQSYTLVVTDVNGCSAEDAVLVTVVPSTLTAEAGSGGSFCEGSGGSVTLGGTPTSVGGTPAYNYAWSGGLAPVANPVASPSTTTTYYVTVTDSKGCVAVDSAKVTVNPAPVACAGTDTAICFGNSVLLGCGSENSTTATGGTAPYTYLWGPATGLNNTSASNPLATPTATTNYTVRIADANGCLASDAVTVTVHPLPTADAGADKTLVACSADSVQIGGSPSGSGGTPPYTYDWSPNGGLSDTADANPYVSHLGSSATYTLVVTGNFGCSASDQVTVHVNNSTLVAEAGNSVAFCQGASVSITLGGSPTAVGGTAPFTYTWSPGTGLSSTSVANPVATPLATTTYSVVVKDGSGCIAEDTVRITINPRPVVSAGVADTVCSGSAIQIGGTPTASGGTGTYTYSWNLGLPAVSNPVINPTTTLTYVVNVTDSLGCSNNASVTIRVNQNPIANAGADRTVVGCESACVGIGATPTATGGAGGYLYAWSPSSGLNNTGLSNPTACGLSQSLTYGLTVTDVNGCTSTDQVLVTVTQSTLTADAGNDKSICAGQPNCVNIGGVNAVTGGTTPYSINWSPVAGICNSNSIANPDVNPTDTTTYVLLVTDAQGCIAVDSMVLYANPAVTASVSPDTAICQGGAALLGSSPTGSGGTSPFTYAWNPGTGLTSITSANPVASPSTTSTYCVTVTDAVGCSSSTCQTVTVNGAITANSGPDRTITNCPGAFTILGGSPTGVGGSNNYSYAWSPSANLNGSTIPNPIVTGLTVTTTFTVTVTDNATGCFSTDQVVVTVLQSNLTADAGLNKVFCANSSGCVLVGGNPTAVGGLPPYLYQWAPVTGMNDPNIANPCVAPVNTTQYALTVTDQLGCYAVDSVTVIVSPRITVDAGNDLAICYGTSTVIGGSPVAVGGTSPYTYLWTPGTSINSTIIAHPTVNPVTNSSYTLTVTDSLGCSSSDIINISIRALPTASAGPDATITACSGDSAILGGSPTASGTVAPYHYSWTPPIYPALSDTNAANPIVKQLGFTTLFTVTVRDSFGCAASDQVQVTVLPNTIFVDAGTAPSLCSNLAGCVTLGGTVTGGFPQYTYQWFGGVNNPTTSHPQACPSATTTYTLVVTDSRGCQAADTVQVIVNPAPNASISGLNSTYCANAANVVMTGSPVNGTFSGPGVTGNIFQPALLGTGFYCIHYDYTDATTGCHDDTVICVTVSPLPTVTATGYAPAYCKFDAPVTLTGSPVGGTFTGSTGLSGVNGSTFNPATAAVGNNVVTYTYTDPQGGCSNTYTFTINVKSAPTIDITASTDSSCQGAPVIFTPSFSFDVFNVVWNVLGGANLGSGLNPISYTPTSTDYCVIATAINTPNGCASRDTICGHVNPLPVVAITGLNTSYCVNSACFALAGSPAGGIFTGPGVSNGEFCPSVAGVGNKCISYQYTDPLTGCTGDTTVCITVNPLPVLSVSGFANTYCPYDAPVTVSGSPAGGTFSGNGISSGGVFTPSLANSGSNTLTYTYTDNQTGCSNTIQFNIAISALPAITVAVSDDSVCHNQSVTLSPTFSLDVVNILWSPVGLAGLNPITIVPTGVDYCISAKAISNTGCFDSTIVCVHVNGSPVAINDEAQTCEEIPVVIDVLANDSDPEGDNSTITVISTLHGSTTVNGDSVTYVPRKDYNGADTLTYVICNASCPNDCDTANVYINICPINDNPVIADTFATTCRDSSVTVCALATDADGDVLTFTALNCDSLHGTITSSGNGCVTYLPASGFTGTQTICLIACDPSQTCDTATITITVAPCNLAPIAVDDNVLKLCDNDTVTIPVLDNDTDPNADSLHVTLLIQPANGGGTLTQNSDVLTYTPGTTIGPVQMGYVVCDNGTPSLCDTGSIIVTVVDCNIALTDIYDTTCIATDIRVCVNSFINSTNAWTITNLCSPANGGVTITSDSCFTYTPQQGFTGTDNFCITVCDINGHCDTATVHITTIDCIIQAVDEPCDLDTTLINIPITLNVMDNDIIPAAGDTTVSLLLLPSNGSAVVNSSNSVTYTPNASYVGSDSFSYIVCAITGSYVLCDTANVCITVKDTVPCYIPNGFSPNGDGVNDLYKIPCTDRNPKSTIRIFDRWGVEVWYSDGAYMNDWNGKNKQGTPLPDGTYYIIYEYNDGTGKRVAKFVVIQR